jgi:hypothetical protein
LLLKLLLPMLCASSLEREVDVLAKQIGGDVTIARARVVNMKKCVS